MAIKILGICGSPRRASTYQALSLALDEAKKIDGVECEIIELRGRKISGCINCNRCINSGTNDCLAFSDDMQEVFHAFLAADAYLIASPVYSMGVTPALAAFFSRFRPNFVLSRKDPDVNLFKVGGAIAVGGTRNGGQEHAISAIHGFYHTKGITVVNGGLGAYNGGSVWSQDGGANGLMSDEIGVANIKAMGRRVAKAAVAMKYGYEQ